MLSELSDVFSMASIKAGLAGLSVLDWHVLAQLRPGDVQRAGTVAERMQDAGFHEEKVRVVIRALFCGHLVSPQEAVRQLELAFDVFDADRSGSIKLETFFVTLRELLREDLEPAEERKMIAGLDSEGTGELDFQGFRDVMLALGATGSERRARVAGLQTIGEDVGLAIRAVGDGVAATLSRHELRVAGRVVRALNLEQYDTAYAAALLPALGMPHPSESQLRVAFNACVQLQGQGAQEGGAAAGAFGGNTADDAAGAMVDGMAEGTLSLSAERLREQLTLLLPSAAAVVWGAAAADAADAAAPLGGPAAASSQFHLRGRVNFPAFVELMQTMRSSIAATVG